MDEKGIKIMKNKILLLTINSRTRLYGLTENEFAAIQPNISMGLLASYIKSKGIEVEIIDETFDFSIPDYVNYILKEEPRLFGVICSGANPSSSTMSMVGCIKFFEEWNKTKSNIKSFIWGGHPSVLPERTLKETNADFVIIGEGYQTIIKLYTALKNKFSIDNLLGLAYFENNKFINTGFPPLIKVDRLPIVDWDNMNPNKYRAHNWHCFTNINERTPYAVVFTSFGCPWQCQFCSINNLFGKRIYRMRSMDLVIKEINYLVTKFNVKNIKILDEWFVTKHKRMDEFCDKLEERKYDLNMWSYGRIDSVTPRILERLKKVGMNWISFGFESISDKIISTLDKGYSKVDKYDEVIKWTKEAGMNICADFMAGMWEDNYDTLQRTYDYAVSHNFEWLNYYPVFAYPGTPMYDRYIKEGIIEEPENWEQYALYGYECVPVRTRHLTSSEILRWRDDKFIDYHSRPEYLSMIKEKFGEDTYNHIKEMVKYPLRRKLLENEQT